MRVSAGKTAEGKEIVILVATSGDTGKAALEGFCDVENTNVIVFFPSEGVSQVQRKQMVTQGGNNTFVTAVKGNFDDCQTGVKKIFAKKITEEISPKHVAILGPNHTMRVGAYGLLKSYPFNP